MSTSSYTVRVGHSIQHLTLSEVEMGGGAITGSELLNRLVSPLIVVEVSYIHFSSWRCDVRLHLRPS